MEAELLELARGVYALYGVGGLIALALVLLVWYRLPMSAKAMLAKVPGIFRKLRGAIAGKVATK